MSISIDELKQLAKAYYNESDNELKQELLTKLKIDGVSRSCYIHSTFNCIDEEQAISYENLYLSLYNGIYVNPEILSVIGLRFNNYLFY